MKPIKLPSKRRRKAAAPVVSPARWAKFTPAQKAVAIAKDAIWRTENKQLVPLTGSWVYISSLDCPEVYDQDVQATLRQGVECQACALGGAVCGLAALEDNLPYLDRDFDGKTRKRLTAIFGENNLRLIELAFEEGMGYFDMDEVDDEELAERAVAFGNRFKTDRQRFLAIWKNVAKHDGVFTP